MPTVSPDGLSCTGIATKQTQSDQDIACTLGQSQTHFRDQHMVLGQ